jgi:small-conductance mechanosensitive channel
MMELILKPLAYLSIKWAIDDINGKNKKPIFDWFLPLTFAILVTFFLYLTLDLESASFKIFFESKGFEVLGNFILALPGFLFAALTAVVSFGNKELDITAKVNPPINKDGHEISRRRYLSNAFSYLTFLSLVLLVTTIFINYAYSSNILKLGLSWYKFGYLSTALIYFTFVFQMLFVLIITLYYIGDKVHQPSHYQDESK